MAGKPLGARAMTPAERQRKHRAWLKDNMPIDVLQRRLEGSAAIYAQALNNLAYAINKANSSDDSAKAVPMTLQGVEHDALVMGFYKIVLENPHRIKWRINCSQCSEMHDEHYNPRLAPEQLLKSLRQKQWIAGQGKKPLCPKCRRSPKQELKLNEAPPTATSIVALNVAAKDTDMATINPTIEITVDVAIKLIETFDKETRRYRNSWTDAKVAEAVGTSEAIVIDVRKKKFGELSEDPAITALRDKIEYAVMEMQEEVNGFKQKLSELSVDVGKLRETIRDISGDPQRLLDRIDRAANKLREECGIVASTGRLGAG
jgi:hypothetical protein